MRRTFLAAALCGALVAAGCAATPDTSLEAARRALAPTGKLRVALFDGNPTHAAKRPSGETVGVAHDVGRKLAERLGVAFEPVPYAGLAKLLDGGRAGDWDVAFLGVSAERRGFLDFTTDYIAVEIGYLVPAGTTMGAVDLGDRAHGRARGDDHGLDRRGRPRRRPRRGRRARQSRGAAQALAEERLARLRSRAGLGCGARERGQG